MKILFIYLLGVGIIGLIESLMFNNDNYYNYYVSKIEEVKNQLDVSPFFTDMIDINSTIKTKIVSNSILSWISIIIIIGDILGYMSHKKMK